MKDATLKRYLNLCKKEAVIAKQRENLKAQLLDLLSKSNATAIESKNYVLTLNQQNREIVDSLKLEKFLGIATFQQFKKPIVANIIRVTPKIMAVSNV